VIGAIIGSASYLFYHSKELRVAQSIAEEYAVQKQLPSDLKFLTGTRSWTKRGDYNLSCFVFLPKNEFNSNNIMNHYSSADLILVRYTDKCPLNTFEVGTTTNSNARNCLTNNAINDAKFVSPPK
jgi:hypothetical protein